MHEGKGAIGSASYVMNRACLRAARRPRLPLDDLSVASLRVFALLHHVGELMRQYAPPRRGAPGRTALRPSCEGRRENVSPNRSTPPYDV